MSTAPHATGAATTGRRGRTILVADTFDASGLSALEAAGHRVVSEPSAGPDTLPGLLAEHDPSVLIVRSTKVPGNVIDGANALALIVRAGAGYDNIDVAAASRRGIFVANCPGKNAAAVAELTWGLIVACDRDIASQHAELVAGTWGKKRHAKAGRGLRGRTLGIVGLGRIGQEVAVRGRAFGMRVIAWSRSLTAERAEAMGLEYAASPLDVASASDVVSINVASTADTAKLVDAAFLAAMPDGAILVNTSRGAVVDAAALEEAIKVRGLRAGLDVWADQPKPEETAFASPLVHLPGVVGTHHCGASTAEAQQAIATEAVRIVQVFGERGEVPNCVNREAAADDGARVVVRHLNRPGVLAAVFRTLSEAGINVEEMENHLYYGKEAAIARITVDAAPEPARLDAIRDHENVISVECTAH